MGVHSTGVQWPAPPQGPHLLICGSPSSGKYAQGSWASRPRRREFDPQNVSIAFSKTTKKKEEKEGEKGEGEKEREEEEKGEKREEREKGGRRGRGKEREQWVGWGAEGAGGGQERAAR